MVVIWLAWPEVPLLLIGKEEGLERLVHVSFWPIITPIIQKGMFVPIAIFM